MTQVNKTAYLEIRSQHAKGAFPRQGPDTYVAVQIVPEGQKRLIYLNHKVASLRGITIIYCGEGYKRNQQTSRSMLRQAINQAKTLVNEINNPPDNPPGQPLCQN